MSTNFCYFTTALTTCVTCLPRHTVPGKYTAQVCMPICLLVLVLLWQGLLSRFHLTKLDGITAWLSSPILLPCSCSARPLGIVLSYARQPLGRLCPSSDRCTYAVRIAFQDPGHSTSLHSILSYLIKDSIFAKLL